MFIIKTGIYTSIVNDKEIIVFMNDEIIWKSKIIENDQTYVESLLREIERLKKKSGEILCKV